MPQPDTNLQSLLQSLSELEQDAASAIEATRSLAELDRLRNRFLGRNGSLSTVMKGIRELEPKERRVAGEAANQAKADLERALLRRGEEWLDHTSPLSPGFDVTRPGENLVQGGLHPTIQMCADLNAAFATLNFDIFDGPEITSEYFAFDCLNFPTDHPARDSMDTYWLGGHEVGRGAERLCLRPHLTGASVRYMRTHEPPFRFVYPGRVYRNESTDAGHERAFFQYEALIVERSLPFTAGRLLVNTILDTVFGRHVEVRIRAGFFPFVEPGFEIDMQCQVCRGKGCRMCKQVGWLEVMPGGLPHPNVLRAAGIDPAEWEGFYINIGLDRLVAMRYSIEDVRLFHGGDLRFLNQFK